MDKNQLFGEYWMNYRQFRNIQRLILRRPGIMKFFSMQIQKAFTLECIACSSQSYQKLDKGNFADLLLWFRNPFVCIIITIILSKPNKLSAKNFRPHFFSVKIVKNVLSRRCCCRRWQWRPPQRLKYTNNLNRIPCFGSQLVHEVQCRWFRYLTHV